MNSKQSKDDTIRPPSAAEPEAIRRKMAKELGTLAAGRRFTPAERIEFKRMADAWAATLPSKR